MFKKEGTVALRKIGTKYSIFFNKRITIYCIDFLLCDSPYNTYGLLRTLCSRNPKNIRNPAYSGYFLMFCKSKGHTFSCEHEKV